jgi:nucleotide-binding universal stress UspA family protein
MHPERGVTRLLCATDLLPKSDFAIDRAGRLADELGADLSLLHVVSPADSEGALEQSLQIAIANLESRARPPSWGAATQPQVEVSAGSPVRLVVDAMTRKQAELLILGPHRRHGFLDLLDGTIVEKALSARKCPVLVVLQRATAAYRNVLLALDLEAESRRALRAAERLVLREKSQAAVIHACEPLYYGLLPSHDVEADGATVHAELSQNQAAAAMRDVLRRASADATRYELSVVTGHPIAAIMRAIEMRQPDLLVMGTRGDGRMRRALIGSIANQVLRAAPCDVLVVPRDTVATRAAALRRPWLPAARGSL